MIYVFCERQQFFNATRKNWQLRRHFCSLQLPTNEKCWPYSPSSSTKCDIISKPLCQSVSNVSSMEYALKSVSGLADVGVLHGDGDGPRSPPRWLDGSGKSFKWLILPCPTVSLLWYVLWNQSQDLLMLGSVLYRGVVWSHLQVGLRYNQNKVS